MTDNKLLLLIIQRMRFLKTEEKLCLFDKCNSVENLPDKKTLIKLIGRNISNPYNKDSFIKEGKKDISLMLKKGIKIVFLRDSGYPLLLKEIYNPPFLLYYRGILPDKNNLSISIIGTRKATGRALREAFFLSLDLARSGVSLISGMAEGIDKEVHAGAIKGGTYTSAVCGCGLDSVYPLSNNKLALSILDSGGSLLSEYPPGTPPCKMNFPERNRIISGLSRASVLVEAPDKSGALITADFALEQGREVYVMDFKNRNSSDSGNMKLIREGAPIVSSAADILSDLSFIQTGRIAKIEINNKMSSEKTGRFLAARMMGNLSGEEISREGIYYRL